MSTALLLIDIQNDYFKDGRNPLVNPDKAAGNARLMLNAFREKGLPVFHVQHLSVRPGSSFFIPETTGAEINDAVKPLANEPVIVKNYPNSFINTTLKEQLDTNKITHLVICGMMTHMCIDATTRAAKDAGYKCTVIADACATKDLAFGGEKIDAKMVHNSFLAALSYYYAEVLTVQDYLK